MKFETGKYYEDADGLKMAIVRETSTPEFGPTLIAEYTDSYIKAISKEKYPTVGWKEITKSEWENRFE